MREGTLASSDAVMGMSAALQATLQHLDDHVEAIDAFSEKRTPEFKGSHSSLTVSTKSSVGMAVLA
jgi:hypothetical protein